MKAVLRREWTWKEHIGGGTCRSESVVLKKGVRVPAVPAVGTRVCLGPDTPWEEDPVVTDVRFYLYANDDGEEVGVNLRPRNFYETGAPSPERNSTEEDFLRAVLKEITDGGWEHTLDSCREGEALPPGCVPVKLDEEDVRAVNRFDLRIMDALGEKYTAAVRQVEAD